MMAEKIGVIKDAFSSVSLDDLPKLIETYKSDSRQGVQALLKRAEKRLQALDKEKKRLFQMFSIEREYSDYALICGVDEVGRGPLAGPVYAGAVILPKDCDILYINDSKKLSAAMRETLDREIREAAVACAVGFAPPERIDDINILNATLEAMRDAVRQLSIAPDILFVDALKIPGIDTPQLSIVKGDEKSASIAAASIVAKVCRDRVMCEYDEIYPGYGFASNKGYGTAEHIEALKRLGPCPIHRKSFIGGIL